MTNKSLFSKLLAGVMSLGLISGWGHIQNAFAIKEVQQEEDDDDDDFVEGSSTVKSIKGEFNEKAFACYMRFLSIVGDWISLTGTQLGALPLGVLGEVTVMLGNIDRKNYPLRCCSLGLSGLAAILLQYHLVHSEKGQELLNIEKLRKKVEFERVSEDGTIVDSSGNVIAKDIVDLLMHIENQDKLTESEGKFYYDGIEISKDAYDKAKRFIDDRQSFNFKMNGADYLVYLCKLLWLGYDLTELCSCIYSCI